MYIGLGIILLMVLVLPFVFKKIEHNLEFFLLIMGFSATMVTGLLTPHFILEIFENKLIYFITLAVLFAGFLFKALQDKVKGIIQQILKIVSLRLFVFLLIVTLGLLSSMITAIIAALLLVEIVNIMPIKRKDKVSIVILACFSIGLGAALTPVGEPLSTIVVSKLDQSFWYLANLLGRFIIPGVVLMGLIGSVMINGGKGILKRNRKKYDEPRLLDTASASASADNCNESPETYKEVVLRSLKIFIFIFALELLGAGFKPLVDTYIIHLDSRILYFINTISAVLDNATIAAAEVSTNMAPIQIKAVLIGLLISGGMLIPGNIPNIISAHKLKITSKEWAKLGIPVGSVLLLLYFVILFEM